MRVDFTMERMGTHLAEQGEFAARLVEARACPNCGEPGMVVFYRTSDVPVHSCLMLASAEAARAFPRRPMRLAVCPACGFVCNAVFDAHVHDYAGGYEDQQTFSSRFREFQTGLVQKLVERYDIRGKNVVEIGCGKGDFLLELCNAGGNRGIGIDPRSRTGDETEDARVRFVPAYYSREHFSLPCDVLCCRHTLEHLSETDRFVAEIRAGLADKPESIVFIEVPDATRIWREFAFWDVYYEHCSYFTPGSLARLFRRNGFEILEIDRVFQEQYLTLVARPTRQKSYQQLSIEERPDQVCRNATAFGAHVTAAIQRLRSRLADLASAGRKIAVWGAGSKCVSLLSTLDCADLIETVVDINPHQQGKFLPGLGLAILPPEALCERRPDAVLIMNSVYRDEIGRQLSQLHLSPELICI